MRRESLSSSTMLGAGYDADRQILEIEFVSGEVYQYDEVPIDVYYGLMQASSHGQYFNLYIRNNYAFIKIPGSICQLFSENTKKLS